jgi:hypothetical protein
MGFFSKLFGQRDQAAASPDQDNTRILDSDKVAASIWAMTEVKFPGSMEVQGTTAPMNAYLYALLKMRVQLEEIEKTKKAGGRVAFAEVARGLFVAGLMQLAGRAQIARMGFDRFAPVCEVLVRNFKRYIEPITKDLDRGSQPDGKIEIDFFERGGLSSMPPNYYLSPVRVWMPAAMTPLVEFLNSYDPRVAGGDDVAPGKSTRAPECQSKDNTQRDDGFNWSGLTR